MIRVDIYDREVRTALERLAQQTADPSAPMVDIACAMAKIAEDSFQSEQSPFGGR